MGKGTKSWRSGQLKRNPSWGWAPTGVHSFLRGSAAFLVIRVGVSTGKGMEACCASAVACARAAKSRVLIASLMGLLLGGSGDAPCTMQ